MSDRVGFYFGTLLTDVRHYIIFYEIVFIFLWRVTTESPNENHLWVFAESWDTDED